jgi:E3 ubiquitin-protein ligase HUWE1
MIAEFVTATTLIPLFQLPAHLTSFPRQWPFPKGDMFHWVPVLNRFDHILELFNQEYGLSSGPQTQAFERRLLLKGDAEDGKTASEQVPTEAILDELHFSRDGDRELVEQIISFTRLLLEQCGNRSLYASSDRLNSLFNTTSISLLKATLRLTHRLAQRYHSSRGRQHPASQSSSLLALHYNITLDRVIKLAAPFPKSPSVIQSLNTPSAKGKEKATLDRKSKNEKTNPSDLVSLVKDDISESVLSEEWGGVMLSYYESSGSSGDAAKKPVLADTPASPTIPKTPTPTRRTSNLGPNQTPRQHRTFSSDESPAMTTPAGQRDHEHARHTGPKVFELSPSKVASTPAYDLVRAGLQEVPEGSHYELLHKIRVAKALTEKSSRADLVAIRLLAVSNLAYVFTEPNFQQKVGQQDSDEPRRLQLAYQLSELVHPPGSGGDGVSRELQTYALNALEALTKHKTKSGDVCSALSVNVNHGVLFYVVRKAVAELAVEESPDGSSDEDDWREALFALLNSLPNSQLRTGEAMVSAGLLEILVEVLTLRTTKAERNHPKVLGFLDTFVYNLRDAFQAMVNAKGLEIIADLASYEVESSLACAQQGEGIPSNFKTRLTDYHIPFYQQQTLRWLFKFMNHMMGHTGGNFDRLLRNLIDSPQLLRALRTVISSASTYGSTVWSMAVTILTSFIHNEPTSYQVIAEAGLSKAFLESVTNTTIEEKDLAAVNDAITGPDETSVLPGSPRLPESSTAVAKPTSVFFPPRDRPLAQGILPVAEAISNIPPAYGAICLAEAGMKLFKSSDALASFFEIFESPAHVKALDSDPDVSTIIGNAFDELVRHHPALRTEVLESVSQMVVRVTTLCYNKAVKDGAGTKLWVNDKDGRTLVSGGRGALRGQEGPLHAAIHSDDVNMIDADELDESVNIDQVVDSDDANEDPSASKYIAVVCKFLGGFFSNNILCASFIEKGGLEFALDFATLPCIPYKFNEPDGASDEVSRVIQLLVESKPYLVLPSLLKRTQKAVDQLEPLMNHNSDQAFFAPFTKPSLSADAQHDVLDHGTKYAKALVTVQTLCSALSLTFQSQIYNHRSTHNVFTQVNLADMYARLVESLGRLHRSCIWEEILLQNHMPSDWEKATRIQGSGFGTDEADNVMHISHDGTSSSSNQAPNGTVEIQNASIPEGNHSGETTEPTTIPRQNRVSAQFKNTQTLRYLLSKVPTTITPFFSSLGKLLLFRRSLEPYHKQCHVIVAEQLAKAAMDQLLFDVPTNADSSRDRYAYWIVILTSVSQLFIDSGQERGFPQALTLVLLSFKSQGGFVVLGDILESFYDEATSIIATQGDEKPKDDVQGALNLSLGGIKIILAFYSQIINSKMINEAGQTTSMQSRPDKDRDKPDYFLPSQFLVELRSAVIKPVQKIWNSDLMDKATTSIVKTLVAILKIILDGETEHGAYKRSDKLPIRSKMPLKVWKVRTADNIQRLKDATENGFSEELAVEALYRCCDVFTAAREYCTAQTTDVRATRSPLPYYEVKKQGSSSPSRAEVVVPEPVSDAGTSGDSEAPDTRSVTMEDVPDDSEPALPTTEPVNSNVATDPEWGGPYLVIKLTDHENDAKLTPLITVDDLDDERALLRKNLIDRSLDVLNVHDNVTFELSDLISAAVSKATEPVALRGEIGSTLVQSLISLQTGDDFRDNGKKIAASAHLLALVLQDKDFYDATVEELKDSFSTLVEFIKIFPSQTAEEASPWIGQVLLIIERLLAEDAQPHQIQWTPPSSDNLSEDTSIVHIPEPVVSIDEKHEMFDAIMEVLPRINKDESLALSVSRVLAMLTRTRKIAVRLGEKRNIQRLFLMVKQLAGITNDGLRSAFMLILRHIIEDEATIRQVMRSEILTNFKAQDRRPTDTTAYTRQMYHLILRAPEIFIEVTNEKLTIQRFEPNQRPQNLVLKKEPSPVPATDGVKSASIDSNMDNTSSEAPPDADKVKPSTERKPGGLERTKTQDLKPPVVENPDGVIHYMLCELLAYKDVEDKDPLIVSDDKAKSPATTDVEMTNGESSSSSETAPSTAVTEPKKADKTEFKAEAHPIYIYRCFILQCLTELLASYNRTKIEFINFSRKADPHAMTPSKPRSGVLNYLLNALVPVGTVNHGEDLAFKKRYATSSCAINVVVALCVKTGESGAPKTIQPSPFVEDEPDLLFVRKFVLEHAIKAFKDACASDEALDMKYSRLLSISDIFTKMILSRFDTGSTTTTTMTPTQKQLAKIMYEKNFISTLTTSIAEIDLNFPNAKRAVKYILRPLKFLTEIAVELSTLYEDSSMPGTAEEDEISTASDVSDIEAGREETPDLFRNSTLGMFEPGQNMESESETSEDEDDDEIYDDQYADDMEYEEEMGQDDDVISEEDEEMDDMRTMEGLSGEIPMDVEVVIGDDGEDDLSEDEDGSDEDDSEDHDDDDIEDMEEVIRDDENASLGGGEEDDWASEDEDHDHDGYLGPDDDEEHDHQSSINQIIQVIGDRGGPGLIDQLEGDMAMEMAAEEYMEEEMQDEDGKS